MPKLPTAGYQQQIETPRATPKTDVYDAPNLVDTARGLQVAIGAVANAVQTETARRDEQALLDYDIALANLDRRTWHGDDETPGARAKLGRSAAGLTTGAMTTWEAEATRIAPKLRGPEAQAKLARLREVRRQDLETRLRDHEFGQTSAADKEASIAAMDTYSSDITANADDDKVVEANRARGRAEVMRQAKNQGWDEATTVRNLAAWDSSTVRGVIAAKLGRDPVAAIDYFDAHRSELTGPDLLAVQNALQPHQLEVEGRIRGDGFWNGSGVPTDAPTGFEANVAHVLQTEGGYVGNDGGKGPTNFGINSTAHPDVDVSKLTREGAIAVYRREYWEGMGIDGLPPALQALVFDAAVNQGKTWTRNALMQAGGDPAKFAQLRRQRYTELATENPAKFGKYLKGWLARVDRLAPTGAPAATTLDPGEAIDQREAAALADADRIPNSGIRDQTRERIRYQASQARLLLQEAGRGRALAKAELDHRYGNVAAKLQSGVDVPLSERPTEAELAAFHGPDEARRLVAEMDTYARMAPDVARLATATDREAATVLAKYAPNPASENFAFEQKAQQLVIGAWQQAKERREADPAAFLAQASPTIAAKAAELAKAQEANDPNLIVKGEAFATALLAEQARLGIPAHKRAVLPAATAQRIRDDFDGKLAEGDIAGAVAGIRGAVAMFGDAGVHLLPQLGENASPVARFALEGLDLRTIETFAAATRDGDKVLKDAVGGNWKDLEEGVRGELAAFDATGSSEYPAYYDATLKIAAAKVRAGLDPMTAAQQAAAETINGRYAFGGNDDRIDYRVPRADIQGRPINTDAVQEGARGVLESLRAQDITTDLPRVPGVDDSELRAWTVRRIQRTGRWLNLGDESGLVLGYQDDAGRNVVARGADGQPIRRTWADLTAQPGRPIAPPNRFDAKAGTLWQGRN